MKKIFISLLIMSLSSAYPYLQEGLYPDCSYIEVTADGWRMHKNQEGRILSMISPESHDTKTGKYSFDKFGNLIPYTDCLSDDIVENKIIQKAKENESEVEIKIELDFSKFKLAPLLRILCFVSFVGTLSGPDTCKKEYKSYRADIDSVWNAGLSGDKWARGEGGRLSMVQSDREWARYKNRWGCEDKY